MTFPAYEKYVSTPESWLGSIPEHWCLKPFWTLFRRTKRTGIDDAELLSVYRDYGVIPKSSRDDNFNKASEDLSAYQLVKKRDLAMNKMKAWQGSLGISEFEGIVSPAYFVFEASHQQHDKYLHYLLRSPRYITGYLSISKGIRVNQWDLDPQYHSRMPVILPPLTEQKAIARFLDREIAKIDRLIEKQERLIELLKEKRQAVISHAVTKGLNPNAKMKDSGVEWLGEVPEHWVLSKLKYHLSTRKGVAFKSEDFTDTGVPVVKASDIKVFTVKEPSVFLPLSFIKRHPKAVLNPDDLILSTVGSIPEVKASAVGQIGKLPASLDGSLLNQNTVVFDTRCQTLAKPFLFYLLQTRGYRDHLDLHAHGTANQASLNVADMLDFRCPVPGTKEQLAIAEYLDQLTKKLKTLEDICSNKIGILIERRSALISAAVTGKIDVRNWQPETTFVEAEKIAV